MKFHSCDIKFSLALHTGALPISICKQRINRISEYTNAIPQENKDLGNAWVLHAP
jgi:hypothetical protein